MGRIYKDSLTGKMVRRLVRGLLAGLFVMGLLEERAACSSSFLIQAIFIKGRAREQRNFRIMWIKSV